VSAHAVPRARDGNFQMIGAGAFEKRRQLLFGGRFVVGNFPGFSDWGFIQTARIVRLAVWNWQNFVAVVPKCFGEMKNWMRDQNHQQQKKQRETKKNSFPKFPFHVK
jgi:hypothetical protein